MADVGLTEQQASISVHPDEVFVPACPGSGKTRAIVARLAMLQNNLPPRKGVTVLSFTNTAVDELTKRCEAAGLNALTRFPNFIGTFDAFIRHFFVMPFGIQGVDTRPTVLDSWATLGVEVRLQGQYAFQGGGVSLDQFSSINGMIVPESVGNTALRQHVTDNKDRYEQSARGRRARLKSRGIISAADARIVWTENLGRDGWEDALGNLLRARFLEVIVDEAQDCNPMDLEILEWLKRCGIKTTTVCDPDQAIYGFRHGNPNDLDDFSQRYSVENRKPLTGNFRSSRNICALAATLRMRAQPDDALGENADVDIPIHVLEYGGRSVPAAVGQEFTNLVEGAGIPREHSILLAHQRSTAFQAAGLLASTGNTSSANVAEVAKAVGIYWCVGTSGKEKSRALKIVERMLLDFMGKLEFEEPISLAIERNDVDGRWLRRLAVDLIGTLPRSCNDSDDARANWIRELRSAVGNLGIEPGEGKSVGRYFQAPRRGDWIKRLLVAPTVQIPSATVHEAKGREYEAACFVIPPNRAPFNRTENLFRVWGNREEDESKRVAYVAVTRAKKLVAIAIPTNYREQLVAILEASNVPYALPEA